MAEAKAANVPVIAYCQFLNSVIDFLIVAFAIFMLVKQVNRLMVKPEEPKNEPRLCPYCKSEINIEATRCPHCTSVLEEKEKTE